jgi:imidazole glycerol-phosphate synthase subunit HisF
LERIEPVSTGGASLRLAARLDVKGPNLIKGIHLEGLRVIGDPGEHARRYYEQGCDELIYMDAVASLYGRNNLLDIVRNTARHCFVPITVGGGIRSVEDADALLRSGADKVAVNTAATDNPSLISSLANRFGSQAVVLSVEAKRHGGPGGGSWEALTNNGRDHSGRNVLEWVRVAVARGAGEILVTSVDREGTRKGFDIELVAAVCGAVNVPVVASGGMGSVDDLAALTQASAVDGVAIADMLHYRRATFEEIREACRARSVPVRLAG